MWREKTLTGQSSDAMTKSEGTLRQTRHIKKSNKRLTLFVDVLFATAVFVFSFHPGRRRRHTMRIPSDGSLSTPLSQPGISHRA